LNYIFVADNIGLLSVTLM